MAELPIGVYPTYSTATAIHLYLPGYSNSNASKARAVSEAPLCGSGTIRGTKKSPRELATVKALREPWRWCAPCVGRWLEASGQLAAAMAQTIARAQATTTTEGDPT